MRICWSRMLRYRVLGGIRYRLFLYLVLLLVHWTRAVVTVTVMVMVTRDRALQLLENLGTFNTTSIATGQIKSARIIF